MQMPDMMSNITDKDRSEKNMSNNESPNESVDSSVSPVSGRELSEEQKKANDGHPGRDLDHFPKDDLMTEKDVDPHA